MGDFIHYFISGIDEGVMFLIYVAMPVLLFVCVRHLVEVSKSSWWVILLWGIAGVVIITLGAYESYDCYEYIEYEEPSVVQCPDTMIPERIAYAGKVFIVSVLMIGSGILRGYRGHR